VEKLVGAVILRSPFATLRVNSGDEESRMFMKMRRARFFAQFTLSEMTRILRLRLRMTANGLRMTAGERFSAACSSALRKDREEKERIPPTSSALAIAVDLVFVGTRRSKPEW
jgi:hypothetical protein